MYISYKNLQLDAYKLTTPEHIIQKINDAVKEEEKKRIKFLYILLQSTCSHSLCIENRISS